MKTLNVYERNFDEIPESGLSNFIRYLPVKHAGSASEQLFGLEICEETPDGIMIKRKAMKNIFNNFELVEKTINFLHKNFITVEHFEDTLSDDIQNLAEILN